MQIQPKQQKSFKSISRAVPIPDTIKRPIYDHLKSHPNSIYVDISPYPDLIPALSSNYEKYVRSEPNDTPSDNLLKLPRS